MQTMQYATKEIEKVTQKMAECQLIKKKVERCL